MPDRGGDRLRQAARCAIIRSNRIALIKSGGGTGPMKPRQPTGLEPARCQVRAGPPAR
jgi:hypothetical protein